MFRWGWNGYSARTRRTETHRVMASVRGLSWEGYRSLIADIFRRRGHEVFAGDGPDSDVIDMELSRDGEGRLIVNCQLRGMRQITTEPLAEMVQVAERNGASGVLLITDGDFSPEAHSFAADRNLILVDGDALMELVVELALGAEPERRLSARLAKLFLGAQANTRARRN